MAHQHTDQFLPASVGILTISDTRTPETDTSGQLIEANLENAGHRTLGRKVIKDDVAVIRANLEVYLADESCEFVIMTGGTGLSARDVTPEAIAPYVTKPIPGFGELFRMLSYEDIGTSTIQSRAEASLCGKTVVFALPGSTGACRLAMSRIILQQIDNTHRPCNFRALTKPAKV